MRRRQEAATLLSDKLRFLSACTQQAQACKTSDGILLPMSVQLSCERAGERALAFGRKNAAKLLRKALAFDF